MPTSNVGRRSLSEYKEFVMLNSVIIASSEYLMGGLWRVTNGGFVKLDVIIKYTLT